MGRIVSGGFKTSSPVERQSQIPLQNQPQQQSEGISAYLARNIAKSVPGFAASAASGFGLGDLINYINQSGQDIIGDTSKLQGPENTRSAFPARRLAPGILNTLTNPQTRIPTREQATSGVESLLSQGLSPEIAQYLTESRPGDYPAEFVTQELPFIVKNAIARGGLTAANLGKSALTSLGILGGSTAGREIGGAIGEKLGSRKAGETLGTLGGGFGGAYLTQVGLNRPRKVLPGKLAQAEESAFKTASSQGLTQAEKNYVPYLEQQKEALSSTKLAPEKQRTLFENTRKQTLNSVKNDIKEYRNTISKLDADRKVFYDNAARLEGKKIGKAPEVLASLREVSEDIGKGFRPTDKKILQDNVSALRNAIKRGDLSLSDAKKFQKNFNDQIYNFDASVSLKRQLNKLTGSLNEFIEKTGTPEHNLNWQKGDAATRELKTLKKGQPEFIKERNQDIRDINKEKFSPVTPEKSKVVQYLEKTVGAGTTDYAKTTLQAALGLLGYGYGGTIGKLAAGAAVVGKGVHNVAKNYNLIKDVLNTDKSILSEYSNLLKHATKIESSKLIARLNDLSRKVEKKIPKEEVTPKRRGIISGGLK